MLTVRPSFSATWRFDRPSLIQTRTSLSRSVRLTFPRSGPCPPAGAAPGSSVRAAAAGETFLSAEALRALAAPKSAAPAPSGLTFREIEVLQCLADGLSNQAIAERLYLSPNTVGNHLQRAMAKLGAHSKLEALVIGVRRGLIALGGQCR